MGGDRRETRLVYWRLLDPDEQAMLGETTADLVTRARWEAAQGFSLSDEIVVTIAAQAAVLVLGLDRGYYRNVTSIIVHPTTFTIPGPRPGRAAGTIEDGSQPVARRSPPSARSDPAGVGPGPVRGPPSRQRPQRGPARVRPQDRHARRGGRRHSPMADRLRSTAGSPCAPPNSKLLRAGDADPLLGEYAATDPGEFFAVATEAFFDRSVELRDDQARAVRRAGRVLPAGSGGSGSFRAARLAAQRRS